ncbi:MAG: 3-oxoacyl-ACP synthase [Deltaproteobacteria bacterium CG_4_10_14_3_um_filter_51_14]|nr:MAG: 3-oxoacyl-ACP synthase [Deltaproteobacteria bacterium CG_4_10_14_3_um_filter_51_14]
MKEKHSRKPSKADWEKFDAIGEGEIDTSDIPTLGKDFFRKAELKMPPGKERITIFLDQDVLEYVRAQGRGYQTRINAILRMWYEAHLPRKVKA